MTERQQAVVLLLDRRGAYPPPKVTQPGHIARTVVRQDWTRWWRFYEPMRDRVRQRRAHLRLVRQRSA